MSGINSYIDYEERKALISNIKKVYPSGIIHGEDLWRMSDGRLLAIENQLTKTKRLNSNSARTGIHIDILMARIGANKLEMDLQGEDLRFYLGLDNGKFNKFGEPDVVQIGRVICDHKMRIESVELLGKEFTRYQGKELYTKFTYFK